MDPTNEAISRPATPWGEAHSSFPQEPSTNEDINIPVPPRTSEIEALRAEIASLRLEIRSNHSGYRPNPACLPPIKLKEIVGTVPLFDGHNLSVLQFTRACRRALAMLPVPTAPETEENLVRLIKSKLQGHAYLVIEDEQAITVEGLCEALKQAFLPNRSPNYYRGELHNLVKKPSEHVLDYISRTKDLRQAILDAEIRTFGNRYTVADCNRIDLDVLECFTNGLPPELRTPLRLESCNDLNGAYRALLKVNQLIERDAERIRRMVPTPAPRKTCTLCGKLGHLEADCWTKASRPASTPATEISNNEVICNYCKKPGHIKFDCEARQRAQQRSSLIAGNAPGSQGSTSAGQAAQSTLRSTVNKTLSEPLPCSSTAPIQGHQLS